MAVKNYDRQSVDRACYPHEGARLNGLRYNLHTQRNAARSGSNVNLKTKRHTTTKDYRTMSRKTAVVLISLVLGTGTLLVWLGLAQVELYNDQMSELIETSPDQARSKMINDLKLVAAAAAAISSALAAFLFWYGMRSLRTQSIPPKQSWVIEGQRIRTGADAVMQAKLVLLTGAIVFLLGIVAAAMLWRLPVAIMAGQ